MQMGHSLSKNSFGSHSGRTQADPGPIKSGYPPEQNPTKHSQLHQSIQLRIDPVNKDCPARVRSRKHSQFHQPKTAISLT